MRQGKQTKYAQITKEELKLPFFADDMIIFIENLKELIEIYYN